MIRIRSAPLVILAVCVPTVVCAQYPTPYDALQAGADAASRYDARRRQAIGMQLKTIGQMKWYSAVGAAGFGTPYDRNPPSVEYVYATGGWAPRHGYFPTPRLHTPDIFQPWPYVPGDIWGSRWNATVRQPIGRREVQTGPNRWESHPVYADELKKTPPADEDPVEVPPRPATPTRPPGPRQF